MSREIRVAPCDQEVNVNAHIKLLLSGNEQLVKDIKFSEEEIELLRSYHNLSQAPEKEAILRACAEIAFQNLLGDFSVKKTWGDFLKYLKLSIYGIYLDFEGDNLGIHWYKMLLDTPQFSYKSGDRSVEIHRIDEQKVQTELIKLHPLFLREWIKVQEEVKSRAGQMEMNAAEVERLLNKNSALILPKIKTIVAVFEQNGFTLQNPEKIKTPNAEILRSGLILTFEKKDGLGETAQYTILPGGKDKIKVHSESGEIACQQLSATIGSKVANALQEASTKFGMIMPLNWMGTGGSGGDRGSKSPMVIAPPNPVIKKAQI